jgi:hypothetical protein
VTSLWQTVSVVKSYLAQLSASHGNRENTNAQKDADPFNESRKKGRCQTGRCQGCQTAQDGAEVSRQISSRKLAKPALLAGGNPQIAKAYGDGPVQAYIAAMLGWKRGCGRRLDALIARAVPGVRKAVKWNSPFYGVEEVGGEDCRFQTEGRALSRHPRGRSARGAALKNQR